MEAQQKHAFLEGVYESAYLAMGENILLLLQDAERHEEAAFMNSYRKWSIPQVFMQGLQERQRHVAYVVTADNPRRNLPAPRVANTTKSQQEIAQLLAEHFQSCKRKPCVQTASDGSILVPITIDN